MLWNSPALQISSLLPHASSRACVPARWSYSMRPECRVLPALAGPSRNCLCSSRIIECSLSCFRSLLRGSEITDVGLLVVSPELGLPFVSLLTKIHSAIAALVVPVHCAVDLVLRL